MYEYKAKVIRVVDGDTLELDVDLGFNLRFRDKFRVVGVDTPEVYGVKKGSVEYVAGKKASEFTTLMICQTKGNMVTIRTEKSCKYGRYLAEVILSDGRSLGEELIKSGNAKPYFGGKR